MKRRRIIEINGCSTCPNKFPTLKNAYRCLLNSDLNPLPEDGSIHNDCPLPSLMDYRTLIKKYMAMICRLEGTDYTESFNMIADWSDIYDKDEINKEEAIELIKLSEEDI